MKKILIVEDDKFFRYAVRKLVEWKKYGFEIVGDAVHGQKALDFLKEQRVDIILTDMNMPVMNGIELTKAVKSEYPEIMIIALSAYDDFEFVKESIKHGAKDYILKQDMEGKDVGKILQQLWEEHVAELFSDKGLRRDVFDFIKGNMDKAYTSRYLELILTDKGASYLCLLKTNSDVWAITQEKELENKYFIFEYDNEYLILVKLNQHSSLQKNMDSERELIRNIECMLADIAYYGCISKVQANIKEMQEGYSILHDKLGIALLSAKKKIFTIEELASLEESRIRDYLEDEASYSDLISYEMAVVGVNNLTRKLHEAMPDEEYVIKNYLRFLNAVAANMQYEIGKEEYAKITDEIKQAFSIKEKQVIVMRYLAAIDEAARMRKIHPGVIKALNYIKNHYFKDIQLSEIASEVGMNGSYLSNIFKKEMGIGISEYISKVRIEEAKRLLVSTSKKNYEIAEAVGIYNPSYFSTLFKKETGMTIQEYKKIVKNNPK